MGNGAVDQIRHPSNEAMGWIGEEWQNLRYTTLGRNGDRSRRG